MRKRKKAMMPNRMSIPRPRLSSGTEHWPQRPDFLATNGMNRRSRKESHDGSFAAELVLGVRASEAGVARVLSRELRLGAPGPAVEQERVDQGRLHATVPGQLVDRPEVLPAPQQVRREGVPQRVPQARR